MAAHPVSSCQCGCERWARQRHSRIPGYIAGRSQIVVTIGRRGSVTEAFVRCQRDDQGERIVSRALSQLIGASRVVLKTAAAGSASGLPRDANFTLLCRGYRHR